ncbi:MAG: DUF3251 domain-containing protein [Nitrososphaerales archaeon]
MRHTKTAALLILSMQVLAGCDKAASYFATQKELDLTKQALSSTQEDLNLAKSEVEQLKNRLVSQELKQRFNDWKNIAYLTPGDEGYSTIHFDLGVLTVKISDVKAYANGSTVNLQFGNTLSASIDGLKANIDWGKVSNDGTPINEDAKTKEITFAQKLKSGSWTIVPVVLDGIPSTELGFVRVRDVTHTGIQLSSK